MKPEAEPAAVKTKVRYYSSSNPRIFKMILNSLISGTGLEVKQSNSQLCFSASHCGSMVYSHHNKPPLINLFFLPDTENQQISK
jgi:hypothetical protein